MEHFVTKHADKIHGTLSCFDRILFRGYLPFVSGAAMAAFLDRPGVRRPELKGFLSGRWWRGRSDEDPRTSTRNASQSWSSAAYSQTAPQAAISPGLSMKLRAQSSSAPRIHTLSAESSRFVS